jgi:catalase (peroxidase I)
MVLISPSRTTDPDDVSVAMVTEDLFALLAGSETIGFVHKVGRVYVSLRGADVNAAVEVGQSLSWDRALEAVRAA